MNDYVMMKVFQAVMESEDLKELPQGKNPPWIGDLCKHKSKIWLFRGDGWVTIEEYTKQMVQSSEFGEGKMVLD